MTTTRWQDQELTDEQLAALKAEHGEMPEMAWDNVRMTALCSLYGHPFYADGRCVRCRIYQVESPDETAAKRLAALRAPRNERPDPIATCQLYDREQGCPLHGELCAPEYR